MAVMKLIFSDERVIEITVLCGNLNLCSAYLIKAHVLRFAASAPLPFQEKNGVGLGDVVGGRDFQLTGDGIDPFVRPLDLAEIADWSFVDQEMALSVRPLAAKFLVAEDRPESG